jgi:two-component system sensor histidine kinase BaeS
MRRRLTVTMAVLVAGALAVAGLGTLLLLRRSARQDARVDLVNQAQVIAAQGDLGNLAVFRRALRLEGASVVVVRPNGQLQGVLPPGIDPADIDAARLQAGEIVSGGRARLVWVAAPVKRARLVTAIVLTQQVAGGEGRAAAYLLLTGAAALAVAAVVADRLGRRLTRPIEEAEATTRRIAAGDLTAQVPIAPDADPEVASLAQSINTMAEGLSRSRGLERQFLMSVSHELRTPLTSIRGFAEAITDGTARDTKRAARVIAGESRRLERLVGDLLDLAKLEARRFSLDVRTVDGAEVVSDTVEGFRPAATDAGVELDVAVPRDGLPVTADPDRLAQVVANLVENAFKFARSSIEVAARRAGDGVTISVSDDGPGIPPEDAAHIFERLYQSARTPARQVGSGLGLTIVAELVAAMGGEVRAESGTAGGARLVVMLNAPR